MGLPLKVKTWQYNVNQTLYNANSTLSQRIPAIEIKNSLIGFGSNPWVVWGSSSGLGGGQHGNNDGVDRWLSDPNNIVAGQSWIVLENIVTGAQICLHFSNASYNYNGTIVLSLGGEFGAPSSGGTGIDGTQSARPTSADQIILHNNAQWSISSGTPTYKLHTMHSTDGECSRIVLCHNNIIAHVWILDTPSSPITGWSSGIYGMSCNFTTTRATYNVWKNVSGMYGKIGLDNFVCFMTCEGSGDSGINAVGQLMTFQDDDTLEWPIMPIGLLSIIGSHRGRKGALYDLWWGSTAAGSGNTYPEDGSNQFVQFDHLIFPWNGSTPEIA